MPAADPDIICTPAPVPVPDERSIKTENVACVDPTPKSRKAVTIGLLAAALVAGVIFALAMHRSGGTPAASATAEVVAGTEGSAAETAEPVKTVATATTVTGDLPAECAGEIADPQLRWYCTQFLPFAKKAAADHDRLDRLEASGKEPPADAGVPLALWAVLAGFGLLTVINTLLIASLKRKKTDETSNG